MQIRNPHLRCGVPAVVLAASMLVPTMAVSQTWDFDPLDPFAEIETANDWLNLFRTNEPDIIEDDPFGNLTSGQWWSWTRGGEWVDAHAQGMSINEFIQSLEGPGGSGVIIRSPYEFESAEEHFNAWRDAAGGGDVHTRETLPDWSGDWNGGNRLATQGAALVRDLWDATHPDRLPAYEQQLQAELESRSWWPADSCLPNGFMRSGWSNRFFMLDTERAMILQDQPVSQYRVIYHDGRDFMPDHLRFVHWYGESVGFWDNDELIVWTRDIMGPWSGAHNVPEHSEQLELIERYKRLGDTFVIDIVMYDPIAFAHPWHEVATYSIRGDYTSPPVTHNECVSTNNTYHDPETGMIAHAAPGDFNYRNIYDPRPWASIYRLQEEAQAAGISPIPSAPSFLGDSSVRDDRPF